jgi:hypothetical protein
LAHSAWQDIGVIEGTAGVVVIVEDQSRACEDDDCAIRLNADARQELIVGLAGDGKDRDLLALHRKLKMAIIGTSVRIIFALMGCFARGTNSL